MSVGYATVSRKDQRLELQRDALSADGCERVFEEKVSSREAERKALREVFDWCCEGDVLVVVTLDRLGRLLRELIDLVGELERRGVGFWSFKESLDTTTPGGSLIFHVFGVWRSSRGRSSARERLPGWSRRGHGGRPRALDENRAKLARKLKWGGEQSVEETNRKLGVVRSTLYRYLAYDDSWVDASRTGGDNGPTRRPALPLPRAACGRFASRVLLVSRGDS